VRAGSACGPGLATPRRLRGLELLGRVVCAAHDDDVFVASAHKELAVVDEPQVARVQPAVVDRLIGQVDPGEVAGHDAGPANEDVTDAAGRQRRPRGVADLYLHTGQRAAHAHQLFSAALAWI
jgi:hypothetical protein